MSGYVLPEDKQTGRLLQKPFTSRNCWQSEGQALAPQTVEHS
jgi:hypothetical protein